MAEEKEKIHCNTCVRQTNHEVLWEQTKKWDEEYEDGQHWIEGADTYRVIQCGGCDSIRLHHSHWFSEDVDVEGRAIVHDEFFPPNKTRHPAKWRNEWRLRTEHLEQTIFPLMDEINTAYSAGSYRLAAMGLRSLLERIMSDQIGDHDTFNASIEAFFKEGHVSQIQQDQFRSVLVEAGHAATHRGYSPSKDDLDFLLDVIEGLIDEIYFRPARAKALKDKIPVRAKHPKKPATK